MTLAARDVLHVICPRQGLTSVREVDSVANVSLTPGIPLLSIFMIIIIVTFILECLSSFSYPNRVVNKLFC